MKFLFCFVLAYSLTLSGASVICNNNLTKEEYVFEDDDVFDRIINFTQIVEFSMNDVRLELQSTNMEIMNNTNKLEKRLDVLTSQFLNLSNKIEYTNDHLNQEYLNSIEKIDTKIQNNLKMYLETLTKRLDRIMDFIIRKPVNCKEALSETQESGIYEIQLPEFGSKPFEVVCDNEQFGGKWTVVMRRFDGSVDFYQNWDEYKVGFGNLNSEFFIGLEKLHLMTTSDVKQELLVITEDFRFVKKYAKYDNFRIGSEAEGYKIKELGNYNGNATNALQYHLGMKFTTKDVDNDMSNNNCAKKYNGAWWFNSCYVGHLFGRYTSSNNIDGCQWNTILVDRINLRATEMLIRPYK